MDPVDSRAPSIGIDWPGPAQHQDGHPVHPGVEDRHGGVLQPDDVVGDRHHRLTGRFGVPVRNGDRDLFVAALDRLGEAGVAEIHDRVVNASEA